MHPGAAINKQRKIYQSGTGNSYTNGFTLIEVIIAVFVVAFSLVAILEIFNIDIRSSLDAREQLRAAVQAQQLMEQQAKKLPPRDSSAPLIMVEKTGLSEIVTVNVQWEQRDTKGSVVIVREFFL